jgi:glucose/arabinose dehydrogenase
LAYVVHLTAWRFSHVIRQTHQHDSHADWRRGVVARRRSRAQHGQTFAPHELNAGDAPAPIMWSTPDLPRRSLDFESAEERKLKVTVLARHLEQPWSVAFLPEGSMLVTERAGRLRIVRDGRLEDQPIAGVPEVQPGGPRGLQGLMDVALHPQFERNHWPAIYTLGHRNGHGLAVNPETGELWESEQGPSGGDELNVLRRGRNYGWPLVSFGRDYWGTPISRHPSRAGMEDPVVVWLPSIGATGMTFYTGDRFPHWRRNVFVAGLREGGIPRTGQLQRVVFNDQWQELRREPLLVDLKQRLRDVRQGPDGLLYLLTAEDDGALLRSELR